MTSVSIIIPAWNETKVLRKTLEALAEIDFDKQRCQVLIVAGGTDGSYEIAQGLSETMNVFAKYHVVCQNEKRTKNAAIQRGIEKAKGRVIVLLDADTIVSGHWMKSMFDPIDQGLCDLTIANSEPVKKNWVSDYYMIVKTYFLEKIATYSGHSIGFRASIIENDTAYFFDESVWMGDDYVFQKRAMARGYRAMFIKEANVWTYYPSSLRKFMETEFRWLMASIHMNGISHKSLVRSVVVVLSLICLIPFFRTLFVLSLFINTLYVAKKVHMFFAASRLYATRIKRVFGFVGLSYLHHVISLVSHIWYFLGLRQDSYYQGERC